LKDKWKLEDTGMEMNVEKSRVMRISRHPTPVQIIIAQNQPEYVEYFNYLGSMITKNARCTREIKSRIAMTEATSNRRSLFSSATWT
jgi:hypothetical protein